MYSEHIGHERCIVHTLKDAFTGFKWNREGQTTILYQSAL